jgi:uncharacterized membrane protein YqjE
MYQLLCQLFVAFLVIAYSALVIAIFLRRPTSRVLSELKQIGVLALVPAVWAVRSWIAWSRKRELIRATVFRKQRLGL